ncbi:unnamed protein product [Arabidopsis thaliana]|uniref:Uncharacterized protein n=1 Tax=Arabidopsis thaliana TaxID=3702 RepID=A0A654FR43_ARATH|nr:unnamed protein product [Arabidopsis thaliana]
MILISLCFTTFLAFLFLNPLLKRTTTTKPNQPPSPWRLPVIGYLHQLSLHPHRSFRSLSLRLWSAHAPSLRSCPYPRFSKYISSSDVAHDVMKTHDLKFANRPKTKAVDIIINGGRDVAFSSYGEYWRQMKSLCTVHLLGKQMVRSFEKVREEEITSVIWGSLSNKVLLLCRREENTSDFENQLRKVMELLGAFPVGDYIPGLAWIDKVRGLDRKMEEVSITFVEFLERVVQEHVDEGGTTTTFTAIDWAMTLVVFINAWAIHRDTEKWGPYAEEFKPERHLDLPLNFQGQDFNFIPFGSGRRLCPAIDFATMLIEVGLANFVYRFNWRVETRPLGDDDG